MNFGDIIVNVINFNLHCLTILGFITFVYYLIYIILPWYLDCDLSLAFAEKFGKPIESLAGNVVWITGASSGIGEHLAYTLAKAGCKLVLSARRESQLQNVKAKCLSDNTSLQEDDIIVLPLDVCDLSKHKKAFDDVLDHFGKLDILVNNAGRSQRANWEKIDIQVDKDMFNLNVFSILSLSRTILPYFLQKNSGHIVITSSVSGIFGIPFSASYTGSKHSLHGYFDCLRNEKIESNIAVTIVCPGPIQTNFLQEAFTEKPDQKFDQPTPVSKEKLSAERCTHLMAIAMSNKLPEVWISQSLFLQLMYLNKYYPNLGRIIMNYLGTKFIQRIRDTKVTVQDKSKEE